MLLPRIVVSILTISMMVLGSTVACGQTYPSKPIRIVTAPPAGGLGGADFAARLIAQGISGPLGQSMIIDNRPTTTIGGLVSKAPPDGYTLALLGNSFWILPFIEKTSYDPVADFSPITLVNIAPNVLFVHPSLPVKSVKELIALAKARPGQLNYAGAAPGSGSYLASELFKSMAGVKIVGVNYTGGGPAMIAVLSGEVQLGFSSGATPYVKSGRLRGLAVSSAQPSVLYPNLPTIAATVPGYVSDVTQAMFAPAKTPDAIIRRLNEEIVRVLNRADIKEQFFNAACESAPSSPEDALAVIKDDMTRMGKMLKSISSSR